jgi:anti-sigma factor RsiW
MISVFVWPRETAAAADFTERRGYHMIRWGGAGLSYCAVSDLNERELRDFMRLLLASS